MNEQLQCPKCFSKALLKQVLIGAMCKECEFEFVVLDTRTPSKREVALIEALTPSAATKAEYIGEFSFKVPQWDEENEEEIMCSVTVPWTTTKEIMRAIMARAALGAKGTGNGSD